MNTNDTTLPFFLGSLCKDVEKHIGLPKSSRSEFGEVLNYYPDLGLSIKYRDGAIIEIQVEGHSFQGKVGGLAISDPIEQHRARLGIPFRQKEYASTDQITWAVNDFFLVVDIWNESGSEEGIGEYKKNHVREIKLKSKLLTPEEERARCAEVFRPMFPDMSLEQIESMLLELESKKDDNES